MSDKQRVRRLCELYPVSMARRLAVQTRDYTDEEFERFIGDRKWYVYRTRTPDGVNQIHIATEVPGGALEPALPREYEFQTWPTTEDLADVRAAWLVDQLWRQARDNGHTSLKVEIIFHGSHGNQTREEK